MLLTSKLSKVIRPRTVVAGDPVYTYDSLVPFFHEQPIFCRTNGASAVAPNNTALSSLEWENEGTGGYDLTGTAQWKTNIHGTRRGILSGGGGFISSQQTVGQVIGVDNFDLGFSIFAVERRTGTQGTGSGSERYGNSAVYCDSGGYFGLHFQPNSRKFVAYSYATTYFYTPTGSSFTDGQTYVLGIKYDYMTGVLRANLNGSTENLSITPTPESAGLNSPFLFNMNNSGTTNYSFEYIVCIEYLTDSDFDLVVQLLMNKWAPPP